MSCTDYYAAVPPSPAQRERTESGRALTVARLRVAAGTGARVELVSELRDIETGARLDLFTVVSGTGRFSAPQRHDIGLVADDAEWFGSATAKVSIDQRHYDTRWLAFDFTREQRTTLYLVMLGIVLLVGALCYVEHYRTEHIGGAPLQQHDML